MKHHTPRHDQRPRKQWTPGRARRLLAALSVTQESIAAFCRRHRTTRQRLAYWRARLRDSEVGSGFTQLVPASTPVPHVPDILSGLQDRSVTLRAEDLRLRVGVAVDIQITATSDLRLLRRVVEALS